MQMELHHCSEVIKVKTVKQRAVPLIMVIMAVALVALTSCTAIDKPASEGSESDSTVGITDNELQEINSVVDSETVKEDETGVAEAVELESELDDASLEGLDTELDEVI